MSKLARNILIFVVIIFFLVAFTPSYNTLDIDNLVYVVAIGIDRLTMLLLGIPSVKETEFIFRGPNRLNP